MLVDLFVTIVTLGVVGLVAYGIIKVLGEERIDKIAEKLGF